MVGGDIYGGMESRFVPNKAKVFAVDTPRVLRAVPMLDRPLSGLGLADAANVVQWLGLTPAFTEFVTRGWFFTLGGALLMLLGSLALPSKSGLIDLSVLRRFAWFGSALVVVALGVVGGAGYCLNKAKVAIAKGDYVVTDCWLLCTRALSD